MQNIINGALIGSVITISYNHFSIKKKVLENDLSLLRIIKLEIDEKLKTFERNRAILDVSKKSYEGKGINLDSMRKYTTEFWDLFNKLSLNSLLKTQITIQQHKILTDFLNSLNSNREKYKIHCSIHKDFISNLTILDNNIIERMEINKEVFENQVITLEHNIEVLQYEINNFYRIDKTIIEKCKFAYQRVKLLCCNP